MRDVSHGTLGDGNIVPAETVVTSGSLSAFVDKRNLTKIIIPGMGESTCDVPEWGRSCPATGSGGSVMNDVGSGTS